MTDSIETIQWEYCTRYWLFTDVSELAWMGQDGWELVAVKQVQQPNSSEYIFKRVKRSEDGENLDKPENSA